MLNIKLTATKTIVNNTSVGKQNDSSRYERSQIADAMKIALFGKKAK